MEKFGGEEKFWRYALSSGIIKVMSSFLRITKETLVRNANIFLVLLAFALMVLSSYLFVSNTEKKNLKHSAENAMLFTEANIKADMQGLQTLLGVASQTIADMIINGEGIEAVNQYILFINNYIEASRGNGLYGATGIFGVFDAFDGLMLTGGERWGTSDSYSQRTRPWYTGAILSSGEISVTEPYRSEFSRQSIITLSCRIFGNSESGSGRTAGGGRTALGIIGLNIELDRIAQYVVNTQFVEGGYGFLLSENMMIISHPDSAMIGQSFREIKSSGIAAVIDESMRKGSVFELVTHDYRGVQSITFVQQLENGWYMAVVTPRDSYFKSTRDLALALTAFGAFFAALLIWMLVRISTAMLAAMRKSEAAEGSNKAKSGFLARMSHEIRTPMNAIMGITEIQLQDESHRPETKEALERISNSGDLLLGIINDILDLSKIEAGKLELVSAQYDTASLFHDTVQLNIMRYETKPIEFILDVTENLPLFLIGDELRIKQILNNLLSNAFKYTDEGTVKLCVCVEPADHSDPSKKILVFIISDTGQGMTAEQVQKLGTEYSRFNMEANIKTEGTGLGMNITQNLIRLMNGSISVESVFGKGSTFTVRIPQECTGSVVIGREIADKLMALNLNNSVKTRNFQINREFMPYGRVLVVDDVETNLYVARGLMFPYGLSVETAISGFEAIDKIKNGSTYDIIFMDHMMPKMDGIEAAKIIRELGYSQPIVALTANAISGQAAMFMENGFDDFISKPIDTRQLNMTLNKLIRDKQPPDVVNAARKQKDMLYSGNVRENLPETELAEIFARDAKRAVAVIEAILYSGFRRDDDISMFIINIHAMKSALANVGEAELSAEAQKLEQVGRERNIDLIMTEMPPFIKMIHKLIEKFELKNDSGKTEEDEFGDIQYLKEKLLVIKEACGSYDKKTAKKAYAEIKKKTWPQPVNEQLNLISVHLLHSEFDDAVRVIDGFLTSI